MEMTGEDRYDVTVRLRWPIRQQFLAFVGVMTGFATVYYFLDKMKMFRPVIPKQYPIEGKQHYSFELSD